MAGLKAHIKYTLELALPYLQECLNPHCILWLLENLFFQIYELLPCPSAYTLPLSKIR